MDGEHQEEDEERRRRAEARRTRVTIQKGALHDEPADLHPVAGAEGISLVVQLSRACFSLSGVPASERDRAHIPVRFVPFTSPD